MAELSIDMEQGKPEFSEEELDSLQRGEQAMAEQQEMLAGKFKDAEELEKAYIELQKKLGSRDEPEAQQEELRETEASQEVTDNYNEDGSINWSRVDETYGDFVSGKFKESGIDPWKISEDFWANGQMSDENYSALESAGFSRSVVDRYLSGAQAEQPVTNDLTETETNTIFNQVGGEASYNNLMEWASENLPDQYTQAYDRIIDQGDAYSIQMALAGIQAQYEAANGVEGNLRTGRAVVEKADVFRSQAEVIQAMNDPRYESDPAYRQDVFQKLERSEITM